MLDKLLSGTGHLEQSVVLDLLLQIARDECLTDDGVPYLLVLILASTELVEVLMLMSHYLVGVATHNEVDNIVGTEVLLDSQDGLKHDDQLFLGINPCARMQTVVAVATVVLVVCLTKIMKQHLTTTDGGLSIGCRLLQELAANVLLSHRLPLHKLIQFRKILMTIESQTDALTTITAGTTGLLIIAFERLRYVVMDHETHVGLVDTHTKGDGGNDNIDSLHKEVVLRLRAGSAVKTGMIGSRLDIISTEHLGQVLHLLARQAIDDATLAWMLLDKAHDILVNLLGLGTYLVIEVGTVERALKLLGINNAQTLLDIGAHLIGGCGRQGDDRSIAYLVDNRTDAAILRTEVMSPLRDTMGLVDGIERDLHRLEKLHILFFRQRLRGYIEQLRTSFTDIFLHQIGSRLVERRVQKMGRTFMFAEMGDKVHLVLHQGDEGGYDNSHPVHQ